MYPEHFTTFQSDIGGIEVPNPFPFPFRSEPHELCAIAAQELQHHLAQNKEWNTLLGLEANPNATGKMFGVLVVQHRNDTLGYLSGFSGAINGCNSFPGFVPAVYDLLNPHDFFKQGEAELTTLNQSIHQLENSTPWITAQNKLARVLAAQKALQETLKRQMKTAKLARKKQRQEAETQLTGEALTHRLEELNRASQLEKIAAKKQLTEFHKEVKKAETQLLTLQQHIDALKQERKEKSAQLQAKIFDQFKLLNIKQEVKTVSAIFREQGEEIPPAGAGDCAGPKLLQYAFQHQLKPIALAEFWWGASPKSEIRKHKHFYPPCQNKCAPIFPHLLKHMEVETDPITRQMKAPDTLEILFEDECLMVVNKPEQFLSVPGKEVTDSVQKRIKQMRPEAEGPLLVHRLDMATSGILLIAKDAETHKALQHQFIKRTTQKRYVAILDGLLAEDSDIIDLPLRVDLDNRPQQLVCYEHGKAARTRWEVVERKNGKTRVYFYPVTGRTHQLRVHAAHPRGLNTPILGDSLYGKTANRLHLHADFLSVIHPHTHKPIEFHSPAPF